MTTLMWAFCVYRCNQPQKWSSTWFCWQTRSCWTCRWKLCPFCRTTAFVLCHETFPCSFFTAACLLTQEKSQVHAQLVSFEARVCHQINFFCFFLLEKQSRSVYFQICEVLVWVNMSGVDKQWLTSASHPYDLFRTERSTYILLACSGSCRHPSAPRLPTLRRMFSKMGTSCYLSHCFICSGQMKYIDSVSTRWFV